MTTRRAQVDRRSAGRHGGAAHARHAAARGTWQQTFKTIAPYTIEEAYEVADAIEQRRHGRAQGGAGRSAAAGRLSRAHGRGGGRVRLRRRGRRDHRQDDPPPSARVRQRGRARRRRRAGLLGAHQGRREQTQPGAARGRRPTDRSVLDDVPVGLPALTRAVKLQDKAARSASTGPRCARCSTSSRRSSPSSRRRSRRCSRRRRRATRSRGVRRPAVRRRQRRAPLKIDPEAALRSANQKFVRRFRRIEELLAGARAHARAVDARRDGPPVGPGQGRGARALSSLASQARSGLHVLTAIDRVALRTY